MLLVWPPSDPCYLDLPSSSSLPKNTTVKCASPLPLHPPTSLHYFLFALKQIFELQVFSPKNCQKQNQDIIIVYIKVRCDPIGIKYDFLGQEKGFNGFCVKIVSIRTKRARAITYLHKCHTRNLSGLAVHLELVELTNEDGECSPSSAYEWRKTGESIAHNTHLKKLTLRNITTNDIESFFRGVARNSSIQTLCLSEVLPRGELLNILVPFFKNNHNVEGLYFEYCGCKNTHLMASALSQFSSLKEFTLVREHPFADPSFDGQLQPVIDALSSHLGVRNLHLSGIHVGEDASAAFETLLQNTTSLGALSLITNNIYDREVATLASGLTEHRTFRRLSICFNPGITETGWRAVLAALCSNYCGMWQLEISNNNFNDAAAHQLTKFLTTNESLTQLDISRNRQNTEMEWRAIFTALQSPTCALKALSVEQHELGDANVDPPCHSKH